jgi:hypothetical protein
LLVTIEGYDTGVASPLHESSHTLRSSDDGATWGSEVSVREYATDSRPYYESKLLLLDTNELIIIHRTSADTGTHYIQRSSDQGATEGGWGEPYPVFDGYGAPSTIQHSGLGLICITRRNSDQAVIAYTSTNRGVSWSSAILIDDTMTAMQYGCPVEKTDGDVLVVYGSQPTSSISNSDIDKVTLS